jgi:P27 family predicted phage terminase small subunit
MGRPIKTSQEHWLAGSLPQSKAAVHSHIAAGRPKFPTDLGNDPKLKRVFKELCSLLEERRALSKGDRDLIRLYCFVYDRHRRNVALLRTEGELTTYVRLDSHGQPHDQVKENIRLKICVAAEKQMASILSQLGLTPTAKDRARPTGGRSAEELPPNSAAALYPHLFDAKGDPTPIYVPEPPQPELEEEDNATNGLD